MSRIKKRPKTVSKWWLCYGRFLALTYAYLLSNCTYCCKLSFNIVPTDGDHCDICLAGVWLHKERFLRTSSIVIHFPSRPASQSVVNLLLLVLCPSTLFLRSISLIWHLCFLSFPHLFIQFALPITFQSRKSFIGEELPGNPCAQSGRYPSEGSRLDA